jgi:hypothetical protein
MLINAHNLFDDQLNRKLCIVSLYKIYFLKIHSNMIFFFVLQRLKTHVIKKDVNPEWNEDLTLSITDPVLPFKLVNFSSLFIDGDVEN